jgi:hypothetical protein
MEIPSVCKRIFLDLDALLARFFDFVPGNLIRPGNTLTQRKYSYSHKIGCRGPVNREITLVAFVQFTYESGPIFSCKARLYWLFMGFESNVLEAASP